jgi:hypothetical protein
LTWSAAPRVGTGLSGSKFPCAGEFIPFEEISPIPSHVNHASKRFVSPRANARIHFRVGPTTCSTLGRPNRAQLEHGGTPNGDEETEEGQEAARNQDDGCAQRQVVTVSLPCEARGTSRRAVDKAALLSFAGIHPGAPLSWCSAQMGDAGRRMTPDV